MNVSSFCSASIQESPTLDLINDCSRFVTTYFEIINASAPHIYHSALALSPNTSTVRKRYESYIRPFVRVVHGAPVSWDSSIAAVGTCLLLNLVVWSPCSTLIATYIGTTLDILDSATLQRLQTLEPLSENFTFGESLAFSPDSCMLTLSGRNRKDLFVVTWDLQTGGVVSAIKRQRQDIYNAGISRITHSADGKMVAVHRRRSISVTPVSVISIYDIVSGVHVHDVHPGRHADSYPPTNSRLCDIWTHGKYLRFSTTDLTTIVILQVGFSPGSTPTLVEILRIPAKLTHIEPVYVQFLPASCRHALVYGQPVCEVLILDAHQSRSNTMGIDFSEWVSFSSDGRFFASWTGRPEICLWKESSVGYVPQGEFTTGRRYIRPLLSPNGESIIAFDDTTTRLLHTKSFYTNLPGIPARDPQATKNYILEFHPDMPLAAVTRLKGDTVTVLDLKSGAPQLTINAGRKVYGLRMTGRTVVVISNKKVVTWNLLGGDFPLGARVGIEDSAQTIDFDGRRGSTPFTASISPDLRYIAFARGIPVHSGSRRSLEGRLCVYDVSTGQLLPTISQCPTAIRFVQEGYGIRCIARDYVEVITIRESRLRRGRLEEARNRPWGYPWSSSSGYQVTEDGWILGPDGRRLLMLPCLWLSSEPERRVWSKQFLALLHGTLSEPVILEFEL